MSFTIADHHLLIDGSPADIIASPYHSGRYPAGHPRILVMHFTYGASGRSSAGWFRSRDNPGSSAHVVIDRDGSVIQCVAFDTVAWHAGKSVLGGLVGLNQYALGIELANWGNLVRSGAGWASYTGVPVAGAVLAVHRDGNPDGSAAPIGWEPYPEVQFARAAGIARALVTTYGITRIVGHDDIAKGRKWDPGPTFDMARFRDLVFGGAADDGVHTVTVESPSGLNLRKGPGLTFDAIRLLPDGTRGALIEVAGSWALIGVLDAAGVPQETGWVHRHYLTE